MKCVIPGANVKVFGKAIHSLSRIGEELYIEPLEHGLALRTVNSSRSAYACFIFAPSFFLLYDDGVDVNKAAQDEEDEDVLKCKIGMKSCLTVFKSLSTLEKTVDRCKITLSMDDARLVFQLYCRHGIVKTYNLAFIECETLQAVFSKDLSPNVLTAQTRLLCDAVMNFQNTQEEVTLIVNPENVCFKNYVEDESDPHKVIHTQMTLMPDEFDSYQVGVDTVVTFCLKELRAILGFSESSNLPVSIHFESAGKPIVFCLNSDPSFEANFVLATLADPSTQVSCSQLSSQSVRSVQKNRSTASVRKNTSSRQSTSKRRRSSGEDERPSTSKRLESSDSLTNGHRTAEKSYTITSEPTPNPRRKGSTNAARMQAALDDIMQDNDVTLPPVTNKKPSMESNSSSDRNVKGLNHKTPADKSTEDSPVIPVLSNKLPTQPMEVDQSGYLDEAVLSGDDDEVPGTPPRGSQFKSIFFGLSQASVTASQQQAAKANLDLLVLAEDSDEG